MTLAAGFALVRSLTSNEIPANPPVDPPAPAAAGMLAYSLDGDVYVADPDGSNAVKIADGLSAEDCYGWGGEYWSEGPLWSPDGRYLAYRRFTDCGAEGNPGNVVISDAHGNVIATFPADGWDIGWSPDSTRVAVWDDLFETIGVYGLDGVRQMQVTVPPGSLTGGDHDPIWTPDGTALSVRNVEFPLDGGSPRQLPWDDHAYPSDGSQVAFVDQRSLSVARSDGSRPRVVFEGRAWNPVWSPDGDGLAFVEYASARRSSDELRLLDVASGSVSLVTGIEPGWTLRIIAFSPDGDRILFTRTENREPFESEVWSIRVDGSDPQVVVTGTVGVDWFSP